MNFMHSGMHNAESNNVTDATEYSLFIAYIFVVCNKSFIGRYII